MKLDEYNITAFWGPRPETPDALARRFDQLIDRLAMIDPAFGNWIWTGSRTPEAFADVRPNLPKRIAETIFHADNGDHVPIYGYSFGTINSMQRIPRGLSLRVHAGSWTVANFIINDVHLETPWREHPDPAFVTYPIFSAALLALAECFDATWGLVFPTEMMHLWRDHGGDRHFQPGWISYVAPRFAPLITPPQSAIVETRPDGGLLMAATDETFLLADSAHVAVARDINAAVEPLNLLPWPPELQEHST
jgi:hypothetical protein